ncbi:MAG: hypothetical protein OEZ43_21180 [Gammaproteobacteria bacterium]|nr:hypothetical protein [Gammaproteobacteria bacterium]
MYKSRMVIALFFLTGLSGCGYIDGIIGTGLTEFKISGSAQKGPYVIGSEVLINQLLNDGTPSTETVLTEIDDNLGSFRFSLTKTGPILITADGYHFNEITGGLSQARLQLKAIKFIESATDQKIYVNILTHLSYKRIQTLLADSLSIKDAIKRAELEVVDAFQPVLPITELTDFSQLNLFNVEEAQSTGNAYVLALSATIYQHAINQSKTSDGSTLDSELTLLLNTLSNDIGDDGEISDSELILQLQDATRQLNPGSIASFLRQLSSESSGTALPVANMDLFIDTDGDGTMNSDDLDNDNDGIPDESDESPYVYSEAPVLTKPDKATTLLGQQEIIFGWKTSDFANTIEINIAKTPDFSQIYIEKTINSSETSLVFDNTGRYNLRTRAQNASGIWGNWSETDELIVGIFTRSYGGNKSDYAAKIIATSDGGFLVVGSTESGQVRTRGIYLLKIDINGAEQWNKTFDTPEINLGEDVIELANGNFLIVGATGSWQNRRIWLIETDNIGNKIHERIIENEIFSKLLRLEDGYLLATRKFLYETVIGDSTYREYVPKVERFDLSHVQLWVHTFDQSTFDFETLHSASRDSAGDFLLTGFYDPTPDDPANYWSDKAYLYKISKSGDQYSYLELQEMSSMAAYYGNFTGVSILPSGDVFVGLQAMGGSTYAMYSELGEIKWIKNLFIEERSSLVLLRENVIEVVQYGFNSQMEYGLYRTVYDFQGYVVKEEKLIDDGSNYDRANGLSQIIYTDDGGYILLSSQGAIRNTDIIITKISYEGELAK